MIPTNLKLPQDGFCPPRIPWDEKHWEWLLPIRIKCNTKQKKYKKKTSFLGSEPIPWKFTYSLLTWLMEILEKWGEKIGTFICHTGDFLQVSENSCDLGVTINQSTQESHKRQLILSALYMLKAAFCVQTFYGITYRKRQKWPQQIFSTRNKGKWVRENE